MSPYRIKYADSNGSFPLDAPADPELARLWKENQTLTAEWETYWNGFADKQGKAEAAEAKEREDADADVDRALPGWRTRQLTAEENADKQRVFDSHKATIEERKRDRETAYRNASWINLLLASEQ